MFYPTLIFVKMILFEEMSDKKMKTENNLIYESKGTFKSLWNSYKIFEDRIELECCFSLKKIIITRDTFLGIDVYKPPVIRTTFRALKIDLADLYYHVGIERSNGFFKQLRFTPTNPNEFKQKVLEWINSSS